MMVQDEAESTREPINYGRFINRFQPDIKTSIQQLEKMSIFFNQIYIYIYIYIYTHTLTNNDNSSDVGKLFHLNS